MRIMWRGWGLVALIAASLILTNGALSAASAPVVHVQAVVKDGAVRLEATANGPFEYTSYRPSESLFVLDLSGVASTDPAGARVVPSDLVKGYRIVSYAAGAKPVVRLEVLLNQGLEPQVERKDAQTLSLVVSRYGDKAATDKSASYSNAPALTNVSAHTTVEAKAADNAIESINQVILAEKSGQTEVSVLGSGKLNYHVSRLQNPDRIVLDFSDAHLKTSTKQIASNLDPVREVRLAQFTPQVSRIVIDLRTPAKYSVNSTGKTVTVAFAPASAGGVKSTPAEQPANVVTTKSNGEEAAAAQIPAPAAVLPAALTQGTADIVAHNQEPSGQPSSVASNAASSSSAPSAPAAAPSAAPADTPAAPAPAASAPVSAPASDPAPAAASAPSVVPSSQPAASAPAPVPAPVPASVPASAPAVAPVPTRSYAAPVEQQAVTPAPSGRYSGEPISVNLKDVDLRDFFRLVHEISGLNVVVDPNVKGNLTIVLDDVPWDQALDIVLKNNGLEKQLDGNVLRIATKETVKKEAEQSRDLAKAQAEAADVVTTTRVLSYAKAEELVATLKKFLSSRGDVLADGRSNTLIIRDIPSVLPVLDNLIRQLDRKSQQVEIEARVVAANRNFSRQLGTQFGFASALDAGSSIQGGDANVGTSPIIRNFGPGQLPPPPIIVGSGGSQTTSGSIPLNTNLAVQAPTSGISYAFSAKNFALDFVITASEDRGVAKLLSKPKVITQNNQKATVKQGVKIPVQTIVNNTISVQFVDAVLQLTVTPQITAEGTVFMDVAVENDQIDQSIPRVNGIPAIDTQAAETRVLIADGGTVVIGGIIVSSQSTDIQQVPLFGSLPVVGNLFRHTTVQSTAQELLFFLTPRILPV